MQSSCLGTDGLASQIAIAENFQLDDLWVSITAQKDSDFSRLSEAVLHRSTKNIPRTFAHNFEAKE